MHASHILYLVLTAMPLGNVLSAPTNTIFSTLHPIQTRDESNADAVQAWMSDTATVSKFLQEGASITDATTFDARAKAALDAETNELVHKMVLDNDASISSLPEVQDADQTLAGDDANFQFVVDALAEMADAAGPGNGGLEEIRQSGQSVADYFSQVNMLRCQYVLPAIDTYFAAAGSDLRAVRPIVPECQ